MHLGNIVKGPDALRVTPAPIRVTMDETRPGIYSVRSIDSGVILARGLSMFEARDFIRQGKYDFRLSG